ncbi:MAG: metalloregulator ArsR/SmtB family transcription factor [Chloroflexota bacterium]
MTLNLYSPPDPVDAQVVFEPVYSILVMMAALRNPDFYAGIDEWAAKTVHQMAPEMRETHEKLFSAIWLDALANLVDRGKGTESFEGYLKALKEHRPVELRDRIFKWTVNSPHIYIAFDYDVSQIKDPNSLLSDFDAFEAHFTNIFADKKRFDTRDAFELFNQPKTLKTLLVEHLSTLWKTTLEPEWERVESRLKQTVIAFQQVVLADYTAIEALEKITGRNIQGAFQVERLQTFKKIRFLPHIHHGPYILWFGNETTIYFGFPARQAPASTFVSDLTYSKLDYDEVTLANRHQALGDEIRLKIMLEMRKREEMSTQEVIDHFGLNKSAASRHLRLLVATGLINERRQEGAKKVYQLNPKAISEIIQLLHRLS